MISIENKIQQQITDEFHSGYLYLSKADEDSKYSILAKEKIESGMEIFNKLVAANQSCER